MHIDDTESRNERLLKLAIERFDGLTGGEYQLFAKAATAGANSVVLGPPTEPHPSASPPPEPTDEPWWEAIKEQVGPAAIKERVQSLVTELETGNDVYDAPWRDCAEQWESDAVALWDRVVRGDRLAWLLTDPQAIALFTQPSLYVRGAIIPDAVNLRYARVGLDVTLIECCICELVDLRKCNAGSMSYFACIFIYRDDVFAGVLMWDSVLTGALGFYKCLVRSALDLGNASVGDSFVVSECKIGLHSTSTGGKLSILTSGLQTGQQLKVTESFCKGEVLLIGLRCGGQADFSASEFRGSKDEDGIFRSITMFEAAFGQSVFFRGNTLEFDEQPTKLHGSVSMDFAKVDGVIDLRGAVFEPSNEQSPNTAMLSLDHAEVSHDVYFGDPMVIPIHRGAATLAGRMHLCNVHVRGDMVFQGTEIGTSGSKTLIDLRNSTIDGCLLWRKVRCGESAEVDLRHAKVGEFDDDLSGIERDSGLGTWPLAGKLRLDGFTYGALANTSCRSFRDRIRWLQLQPGDLRTPWWKTLRYLPPIDYNPQPFDQLAESLLRTGDEDDARAVLIEKFKLRGRSLNSDTGSAGKLAGYVWSIGFVITVLYSLACPVQQIGDAYTWLLIHAIAGIMLLTSGSFPWRRWWQCLLYVTIGYGYRTGLSIVYLFGLLLIGSLTFTTAHHLEYTVPSDPDVLTSIEYRDHLAIPRDYPKFQPVIFALDTMLPFVDLQQETRWTIIGHSQRSGTLPFVSASGSDLAIPKQLNSREESASSIRRTREPTSHVLGRLFRFYLWGHIAAGWLLTTLLLAGLTGIAKQR